MTGEGAPSPTAIERDIRDEAERLGKMAAASGVDLRLMGGLAIWITCPSVRRAPYLRSYGDLDFAASRRQSANVDAFFQAAGYRPEKLFNALHGAARLNYKHPEGRWPIDVILDEVRMSHRIDLRGRLAAAGPTIGLADLLLTKLQIWEINEKDVGDAVCLLADHPVERLDHLQHRDLLGRPGERVAALGAAVADQDAGPAQGREELFEELDRDPAALGHLADRHRVLP